MVELTPKQETFVQEYVKHGNCSKAARDAGYAKRSAYSSGHRLLQKDEVKRRVAELRGQATERNAMDYDWALEKNRKILEGAEEAGNPQAAMRALENINKLLGHYELHNKQKHPAYENMTLEELIEKAAELLRRAGYTVTPPQDAAVIN